MNRKWLVLFLGLLLCGCRNQQTPVDTSVVSVPAIAVTEPTGIVGFYDSESTVEQMTHGAVKAFPLDMDDVDGIRFLGKDILLFSGDETTVLTLLSGETRYIKAQLQLSFKILPNDPSIVTDSHRFTFWDSQSQALITLNDMLEEISRIPIPENYGTAVLSSDRRLLYYCTGDALRALDLETGLDKLLREMAFPSQSAEALHCSDTVLQCSAVYNDGSRHTLFLAADTGAILYESAETLSLWTSGAFYTALRMDGYYPEWLTGTKDSEPQVLILDSAPSAMLPVPELQSILTYHAPNNSSALLECYQLESGRKTAQQEIPDIADLRSPRWESENDTLWFLGSDLSASQDVLYAWNPEHSAIAEEDSYLYPRWTRENPDIDGLAQCSLLAREISGKHDVNVLIWADAAASQPWDYTLIPEYQVPLLRRRLEELDAILSCYPEGFLKKAASGTGVGQLSICLVRSINGNAGTGALDSAMGLQFWDAEARAYLAVTIGPDMAQHLYHELFHIIDTRVLSTCNAYDDWKKLNPKGFSYDPQYISIRAEEGQAFLNGEKRYFIDLYSMCYPKEDRARIMEYAMLDGQEDLFQSTPVQNKLRKLCLGIREAFHLEDEPVIYRWERYLNEPLASTP